MYELLLLPSLLFQPMIAEAAESEISGPAQIDVGSKLILRSDVAGSWDVGNLDADRYEIFDDGRTLAVWTARPQKLRVILVTAEVGEDGHVQYWKSVHLCQVKGSGPMPPPDPDDDDDPEPPPLTGLAKDVFDLCTQHNVDKAEAAKLAENYSDIAAELAAGELSTGDAVRATVKLNRKVTGEPGTDSYQRWLPFFKDLNSPLQEMSNQNKLETVQHYQTAWLSIGGGLRSYAK
jgi:hypothetical protein